MSELNLIKLFLCLKASALAGAVRIGFMDGGDEAEPSSLSSSLLETLMDSTLQCWNGLAPPPILSALH